MRIHSIDIVIISLYLILMVLIGLFLKKRAGRDMDSYFLGGKSLPFYMLGLSNASGMFDITGTMLMVYWAFAYGFKSLWIPWLWPVFNQIFLMVYLSVWLRRSNVLTGAEWIQTRFGKGRGATLSHTIVVIFALLSALGFLSYGFIGIGKFMEIFFPWEFVSQYIPWDIPTAYVPHCYGILFTAIATFYVMLGGMLSIVWTDVVQFLIMTIAGIIVLIIGMGMVSPEMVHSFVPKGWDSPFFGWTLDINWTGKMDLLMERMKNEPYELFSLFVGMALLKGVFNSIAGPAPNYDMQKILSCRSPKEAALMSGSVPVILLIPRYLMIMGFALLAIYFFKEDGGLSQLQIMYTDFETILPHLITKYVPVGLTGLLLAGLLAAFMSTFASTVNAAPAYVINDIYLKYINPDAPAKTQIRASYLVSALTVIISTVMGFYLKDINEIFQWIVGALFGGYIAANVLKWHWWRFNGEGYFWGMAVGVIASVMMKFTIPDSQMLYYFPVLFLVSLIGCVIGTYTAPPTDENTLIEFYVTVRPWGYWKPIAQKAIYRYPWLTKNKSFKRDMFNVLIGMIWQNGLTVIPMFLSICDWMSLSISIGFVCVTTVVLYYNWYKPLCADERTHEMEMKRYKDFSSLLHTDNNQKI
ncbi:MAG: Na+:solute symporter [Parabacteroides sp.]|nr:Na+:solute symporter [Parabacteroides sp.]MDD7562468.1 Na+:solute symporter [Parabacteroides sp.]MDY5622935.1 sodium:solute symporter family protein [Bacteroidales bacterium]